MTATQTARDIRAKEAIESAIRHSLRADAIRRIVVNAVDDEAGEPSLYVNIHLKDGMPNLDQRSQLRDRIRDELVRIDDERFPYLSMTASAWEADAISQPA